MPHSQDSPEKIVGLAKVARMARMIRMASVLSPLPSPRHTTPHQPQAEVYSGPGTHPSVLGGAPLGLLLFPCARLPSSSRETVGRLA